MEVKSSKGEGGMEFWLGHVHGPCDTRGRSGQTALGFMVYTLHLKYVVCSKEHREES